MAQTNGRARNASKLTRRSIIKATTATTAVLATGGALAACAAPASQGDLAATGDNGASAETGGTWVTAACWHNCGGRCLNKVLVVDGKPVRQKTDDTHEDSPDYPQQRGCLRGRSQRKQVFAEDRIKYPLKRAGWSLDAPNGEMRGKDEWERISWEEAFSMVAAEIKRVADTYGTDSLMTRTGSCGKNIFAMLGGYTSYADTTSYGTYCFNVDKIGLPPYDLNKANDRMDLKNSETIVFYGGNPAWASAGSRTYNFLQAKKNKKTQFIVVGPSYNATASVFEAKWIRVRPGTDTAFLLGVAYEMLALDESQGGIIDWDFLNT